MGFVYNNTWEAFAKTYLELNGYFVLTNTFVALRDLAIEDVRKRRLEADVIATKPANTNLRDFYLDVPDNRGDGYHAGDFFAGVSEAVPRVVYSEIKANLNNDQQMITAFLDDKEERQRHKRKTQRIRERFGIEPTIVIIAYAIEKSVRDRIWKRGWFFKEFPIMQMYGEARFNADGDYKRVTLYNDPWLEMLRFLYFRPAWHEDGVYKKRDKKKGQ